MLGHPSARTFSSMDRGCLQTSWGWTQTIDFSLPLEHKQTKGMCIKLEGLGLWFKFHFLFRRDHKHRLYGPMSKQNWIWPYKTIIHDTGLLPKKSHTSICRSIWRFQLQCVQGIFGGSQPGFLSLPTITLHDHTRQSLMEVCGFESVWQQCTSQSFGTNMPFLLKRAVMALAAVQSTLHPCLLLFSLVSRPASSDSSKHSSSHYGYFPPSLFKALKWKVCTENKATLITVIARPCNSDDEGWLSSLNIHLCCVLLFNRLSHKII